MKEWTKVAGDGDVPALMAPALLEVKEGQYLRPQWVKFIDFWFENGFDGPKAYMDAFPKCSGKSVYASANRILSYPVVKNEIEVRLATTGITRSYVLTRLKEQCEWTDSYRAGAAVSATATLAKALGMLEGTRKQEFSGQNPAVFMTPYSEKEKKEFEEQYKSQGRIIE